MTRRCTCTCRVLSLSDTSDHLTIWDEAIRKASIADNSLAVSHGACGVSVWRPIELKWIDPTGGDPMKRLVCSVFLAASVLPIGVARGQERVSPQEV